MKKLSLLFCLGIATAAGAAQPLDVVINEVGWMGTGASAFDEWIELYNNTAQDIDLSGWYILDDSGDQTYALSGLIPAGGFFLIEDRQEATSVAANLIADLSLGNSGDRLELFDAGNNSIDLVDCGGGWYAGDNTSKSSMERRDPLLPGNLPANWGSNNGVTCNGTDASGNPLNATPGAQNSVFGPMPGPRIANVHCLDLGNIDIYFDTPVEEASAAQVSNYAISLAAGDVQPLLAMRDASDATLVHLQNIPIGTSERARLTATGVKDSATGIESDSSAWFLTGVIPVETARLDLDGNLLPDLYEIPEATFFTVRGVVTTVAAFDYRESYLQDATGGLAVFESAAATPHAGDEVRVSGLMDNYRGKDQMIGVRFQILSHGNPVAPLVLTLARLGAEAEKYESMLIGVASVSRTGGDAWPAANTDANLQVSDDGGTTTYTLRIDRDTDIDGSPEPSWPINLMGIAGQYTFASPPAGYYQLLPRSLVDLELPTWPDGSLRPCYHGPDGTAGVGICREGRESFSSSSGWSGVCEGEVMPESSDSDCDGVDDDCDGTADDEVDLTSPENCGACDNDCTQLPHTTAHGCDTTAAPPACTFQCQGGFGDCTAAAGCETELGTTENCGACGDSCQFPHAGNSTCEGGACIMRCDPGWGDCAGGTADGCETPLGTDSNCSACGDNCTSRWANAEGHCSLEPPACQFAGCLTGFGDCDQDLANGCEASLTTTEHCGSCEVHCSGSEACVLQAEAWVCSDTCHDQDQDGYADSACGGSDCDDADGHVHPGANELCNGKDDDCADGADEDWPELGQACDGPDADRCAKGRLVCNQAGDGTECQGDGEAIEVCNGDDDDCDGEIDEDLGNYTCGVGVCRVTVPNCLNGIPNPCVPDTSGQHYEKDHELSCTDDLDNDCDGYTDSEDLADCKQGGSGCGCGPSAPAGGWLPSLLAAWLLLPRRRHSR